MTAIAAEPDRRVVAGVRRYAYRPSSSPPSRYVPFASRRLPVPGLRPPPSRPGQQALARPDPAHLVHRVNREHRPGPPRRHTRRLPARHRTSLPSRDTVPGCASTADRWGHWRAHLHGQPLGRWRRTGLQRRRRRRPRMAIPISALRGQSTAAHRANGPLGGGIGPPVAFSRRLAGPSAGARAPRQGGGRWAGGPGRWPLRPGGVPGTDRDIKRKEPDQSVLRAPAIVQLRASTRPGGYLCSAADQGRSHKAI